MKIMKWSSLLLLSILFMCAFVPQLSASKHHHYKRSRTSFGLNFNIAPAPNYVIAPAPAVIAPTPYAPAPVAVYRPYYGGVVYPYYGTPVVVQQPSPLYVQPGFSYSYWRR